MSACDSSGGENRLLESREVGGHLPRLHGLQEETDREREEQRGRGNKEQNRLARRCFRSSIRGKKKKNSSQNVNPREAEKHRCCAASRCPPFERGLVQTVLQRHTNTGR